jgi:iron complex transport system substrate-binding protein
MNALVLALLTTLPGPPPAFPRELAADAPLVALARAAPSVAPQWIGPRRPDPRRPARVVTLAPHATELVFALGRGDAVVGVSRFDDVPPEVTTRPRVGGFVDPNLEAIVALAPTLVLAAPNGSVRAPLERLDALGVPVLVVPGNSLADAFHALRAVARALDAEPAAEALERGWWRALAAERRHAGRRGTRFVVLFERDPLIVAGPRALLGETLTLLGGVNVVRTASDYPVYAREQLVVDAPALLVDGASMASWTSTSTRTLLPLDPAARRALSGLDALPALGAGRALRLQGSALLRPGPRLFAALGELGAALDPPPRAR